MKWFSYLLRHGIVVALVVGIAITYVYRQQLFPKFFEQEDELSLAGNADKDVQDSVSKENLAPDAPLATSDTDDRQAMRNTQTIKEEPAGKVSSVQPGDSADAGQAGKDMHSATTGRMPDQVEIQPGPQAGQLAAKTAPRQEQVATQPGQHQSTASMPIEAGVAIDKPVPGTVPLAQHGSTEPAGAATRSADRKATTEDVAQDKVPASKDSAHPVDMAAGMIKDPARSLSGMMQNPGQAMTGMMNRVVPGGKTAPADQAEAGVQQAQPDKPGPVPDRLQQQAGSVDANRPQMAAPPMAMQSRELPPKQKFYQLINKARHAYWQNRYQESVSYYQQAIKLMPDSPEGYGELGNVYYTQGEWDKSGENLYQSAIRLLDQGRADKAHSMLLIIRGLKHERADDLEQRLQALQSGS